MSLSTPDPPSASAGIAQSAQLAAQDQAYAEDAATKSQTRSMVGQANPYGTLQYIADPSAPGGYRAQLNLSPEQQQLFNTLMGTKGIAGTQGQNVLGLSGYGNAPAADVIGDATKGNTKSIMDMYMQAYQPYQDIERQRAEDRLKNTGAGYGTNLVAWKNSLAPLIMGQDTANLGALAGFENQAYNQAFQNYNLPAELAAKLAQLGAPGDPTQDLIQTPQYNMKPASATSAYQAYEDAAQKQYASEMTNRNNMLNGLFGLGTTGAAIAGGLAFPGAIPAIAAGMGRGQLRSS